MRTSKVWRGWSRVIISMSLLTLPAGCITTAEQGRRMQLEIDNLGRKMTEQREDNDAERKRVRAAIAALETRLDAINQHLGMLANVDQEGRRTDADFGATMDRLIAEIQMLRGGLEELKYSVDKNKGDLQTFQDEAGKRLAALKSDAALEAYEARRTAKKIENPEDLFKTAQKHFENKDYNLARDMFKQLLEKWPGDTYASDSKFWLGETYFAEGAWRPAILEYNKFREGYPEHAKVPDALVRIGECFAAINLKPEAGRFLDAVVSRYPDTQAAKEAKAKKKELGIK